jgi:hypothetical protein
MMSDPNDNLPWGDSKKWKRGYYYPMTTSHDVEFEGKEETVYSAIWDCFFLDEQQFQVGMEWKAGDIDCLGLDLTFVQAVKIANRLNPEKIFTFSWAKELE